MFVYIARRENCHTCAQSQLLCFLYVSFSCYISCHAALLASCKYNITVGLSWPESIKINEVIHSSLHKSLPSGKSRANPSPGWE